MAESRHGMRPFTAFNFLVEIKVEGIAERVCEAEFSECDGLEMTLETKTIREGGNNSGPVHMGGPTSYGQLSLKRGMTANFELWDWFDSVSRNGGSGLRGEAQILLRSSDLADYPVWFKLEGCLPVKLRGPSLNAREGLLAIEEMQLVYETLTLKRTPPPGA